ncbi:MAG TPA: DUF6754 domain-containing protein [Planctomycetota bacterium]|nr:DUF6754 domain-containing protein [Planctomycetota bacterium]
MRRPLPLLLLAAALCAARLASAAEHPPISTPYAASFRAYDRPSDDGNAIGVEWAPAEVEGPTIQYIVEVASEEDYQAGKFHTRRVPSLSAFKSDHPEYYGSAKSLRNIHYIMVEPAKYYPPQPRRIEEPTKEEQEKLSATARARLQARLAYEKKKERERLMAERRRINGQTYYFRLAITDGRKTLYVAKPDGQPKVVTASGRPNYFKWGKANNLVFSILFCAIVLGFIHAARKNPNLFIRKIAGLEAVDEAIGRATEMGRPVYFVHGLADMGSLSTIAAVNILARVARRAAEYDTRVRVMNNDPIVLAVSQEVVKQAYTEAGRPDAYNPDDVALVAADQFSYVAAVGGLMVREQPATIFLVGYFYAESLLLAETGASTGAIQIAGTDSYTQLPFFIPTCDYTLMGEELYAASAYLSREPRLLGSLRGQDVGKAFLMAAAVVGTILSTAGVDWIRNLFLAF